MIWFVIHDAAGVILRTGMCPEGLAEAQAGAGQSVLTFAQPQTFAGPDGLARPITDITHRVIDGALVPVEP